MRMELYLVLSYFPICLSNISKIVLKGFAPYGVLQVTSQIKTLPYDFSSNKIISRSRLILIVRFLISISFNL